MLDATVIQVISGTRDCALLCLDGKCRPEAAVAPRRRALHAGRHACGDGIGISTEFPHNADIR